MGKNPGVFATKNRVRICEKLLERGSKEVPGGSQHGHKKDFELFSFFFLHSSFFFLQKEHQIHK